MRASYRFLLSALVISLAMPTLSFAEEGKLMVRARGVYISPADKSDPIAALSVPEDAITVSKKLIPEVDISYFITSNLAAELVLTYPQKHDVELLDTKIGSFKHLPPTLTLQYHFLPTGMIRPYLGAGVNLTLISGVKLAAANTTLDLESSSIGWAVQGGADVKLADNVFLNVDVKKVKIGSDVLAGGAKLTHVDVDPWLFGAGVGYRF